MWVDLPCIESDATRSASGYPREGRRGNLHRVIYEEVFGSISDRNMVVDHICNNRACVYQPLHWALVTRHENMMRARREAEFCKRGHNDWKLNGARRMCRTCKNDSKRLWRALGGRT
jgi:HNH endonuclease